MRYATDALAGAADPSANRSGHQRRDVTSALPGRGNRPAASRANWQRAERCANDLVAHPGPQPVAPRLAAHRSARAPRLRGHRRCHPRPSAERRRRSGAHQKRALRRVLGMGPHAEEAGWFKARALARWVPRDSRPADPKRRTAASRSGHSDASSEYLAASGRVSRTAWIFGDGLASDTLTQRCYSDASAASTGRLARAPSFGPRKPNEAIAATIPKMITTICSHVGAPRMAWPAK